MIRKDMQAIEDKIYNKVKKCGRGTVFSSSYFTAFGEPRSVLKALEPVKYVGLFPHMTDLKRTEEYDFEHLEYTSTSCQKLKDIYEIEERMIESGYFGSR